MVGFMFLTNTTRLILDFLYLNSYGPHSGLSKYVELFIWNNPRPTITSARASETPQDEMWLFLTPSVHNLKVHFGSDWPLPLSHE